MNRSRDTLTSHRLHNRSAIPYHHYGLRAAATEVAHTHTAEYRMKCSNDACSGAYEERDVAHPLRRGDHISVIYHVPALVCDVCGGILFTPETVRRIERLRRGERTLTSTALLYDFAEIA